MSDSPLKHAAPLTRREWLRTVAAGAAGGLQAAAGGFNVLFLMSDEHSPHVAGFLGNKVVHTPAIDSLAARGAAFHAAYTQNPICVPSRASFLTGRMASNVGVFGNDGGLDESVETLATVFQRAGYATSWMGKTHWGGKCAFPTPRHGRAADEADARRVGMSRLPKDARVVDWPVDSEFDTITKNQALRFLEENRGRRFFAGVSFKKPHFPFLVQEQYHRMYQGRVPVPRVTQAMTDELPQVSKRERETYAFATVTEPQARKALEIYYGMVTYMDDLVKEILAKLDALGLRENTIILYTADHGELGGEHGLWYKNSFYEASVRIPMVWSFPQAIPSGKVIGAPVMNMDIFPTLCDLCGIPKPTGLEGKSLVPLMKGTEDGKGRYALSENFRGGAACRMIRTDRFKYCYFHEDREQLFDLRNDPGEAVNLAAKPEHRELAASLKSRALAGWQLDRFFEGRKKMRQQKGGGKKKSGV